MVSSIFVDYTTFRNFLLLSWPEKLNVYWIAISNNISYRLDNCQRIYVFLKLNFNKSTKIDLHKYWWNHSTSIFFYTKWIFFITPPPPSQLRIRNQCTFFIFLWWKFECTFSGWSGSYHTYCIIYSWLCMNEWVKLKQSRVRYKLLRTEHMNGGWCHNIRKLSIEKIFEDRNGIRLINNSVCAPFVIEQQRWFDSCALQIFVWIEYTVAVT